MLRILDAGYGIGRVVHEGIAPLAAPQAGLMQALASGIFGAGIKWNFIVMGFALAIVLIVLDKIQEKRGASFRLPVLAVAVGIYLPLGLSVPIFIGGVISWQIKRRSAELDKMQLTRRESLGLLVASGLITGEALIGIGMAVPIVVYGRADVLAFWGVHEGNLPGVVLLAIVAFLLYRAGKSPS